MIYNQKALGVTVIMMSLSSPFHQNPGLALHVVSACLISFVILESIKWSMHLNLNLCIYIYNAIVQLLVVEVCLMQDVGSYHKNIAISTVAVIQITLHSCS